MGIGGGYFVCVIPGDHELDLKVAAKASGEQESGFDPDEGILPITGYIREVARLSDEKEFPTFIHESCLKFEYILYQCGCSGITNPAKPERFNHLYPGDVDKLQVKSKS